ncbi:MAG TPA: hypothetical protein VGR78_16590 [Verrucomicrobiae bacterium]|jgi:uncharacterized protein YecE (DUF72 family)|nr:hypothetical protein [Verrucomicrobiae bacterium]
MKLIEAYLRARHAAFVAERFNYLYSEKELQEIAGKVKELVKRAKETHVSITTTLRIMPFGRRSALRK